MARSESRQPSVGTLVATDPGYPSGIEKWLSGAPPLAAVGSLGLLKTPLVGFLCSVRCPGDAILKSYDLARALRDADVAVIGGFHSPMEKECLDLLLRGTQPVVVCPARGLEGMRFPGAWRLGLEAGRLLVLSPFSAKVRRATAETAQKRNDLVAALAWVVFVAHAEPGGEIERVAAQARGWGKPVLGFEPGKGLSEVVAEIQKELGQ